MVRDWKQRLHLQTLSTEVCGQPPEFGQEDRPGPGDGNAGGLQLGHSTCHKSQDSSTHHKPRGYADEAGHEMLHRTDGSRRRLVWARSQKCVVAHILANSRRLKGIASLQSEL